MAEGVEQLDRDGLDARPANGRRGTVIGPGIGPIDHRPVGRRARRDLEDHVTGDERLLLAEREVLGVGEVRAADLQDAAVAGRDDQREGRAATLDDRVYKERGAVDDQLYVRRGTAGRGQQLGKSVLDRRRGIVRDARFLEPRHGIVGPVEEHEIGEGPPDVDPDPTGSAERP
jgi:hypothetical protein